LDAPHRHTRLDILSALRVAYAALPAATIAALVPQRAPETAARVQAMLTACDACEAPRNAAIAQQQAAITAAGLATGAMAQGTSLRALIMAPRVTWDNHGHGVHTMTVIMCSTGSCGVQATDIGATMVPSRGTPHDLCEARMVGRAVSALE